MPGLLAATGMSLLNAVGTSPVAVTAFGLTTAVSYGTSGQVDWPLTAVFIVGGVAGGTVGAFAASRLAKRPGVLDNAFTGPIVIVAAYMSIRALAAF